MAKYKAKKRAVEATAQVPKKRKRMTTANQKKSTPPREHQADKNLEDWEKFRTKFGLKMRKVRADGTCWLWAFLANFGLCDHAAWLDASKEARSQPPTAADLKRQSVLRPMLRDYFNLKDLQAEATSVIKDSTYSQGTRTAMGGYGDITYFQGLCSFMKVSCLIHSPDTGAERTFLSYLPGSDSVEEKYVTSDEVLTYLEDRGNPPLAQVRYNGSNHYDLYMRPDGQTLSVPKGFHALREKSKARTNTRGRKATVVQEGGEDASLWK
jgi:hypothetical protein